jgi:hypothetical protein
MSDLVTLASSGDSRVVWGETDAIETELWFKTDPLDRAFCYRATQLQLWTDSHDQGAADDASAGAWTWFELVILEDENATEPLVKDGKEMVWRSHFNRLNAPDGGVARHYGVIFDRRAEILDAVEVKNLHHSFTITALTL